MNQVAIDVPHYNPEQSKHWVAIGCGVVGVLCALLGLVSLYGPNQAALLTTTVAPGATMTRVNVGNARAAPKMAGLVRPAAAVVGARPGVAVRTDRVADVTARASMTEAVSTTLNGVDQVAANFDVAAASSDSLAFGIFGAVALTVGVVAAFTLRKENSDEGQSLMDSIKVGTMAAATTAVLAGTPLPAKADIAGLTPCSESKEYAKVEKKELKNLTKRQKLYAEGSPPYLALEATKDRTVKRFADYKEKGALCGTDGLPHLISDPGLALRYGHAGEVFIPTVGFLYIAGWIGSVGRSYIQEVKTRDKPQQSEIIIDVPLATKLAFKGAGWPAKAIQELKSNTLTEKEENITVSPR